MSGDAGGGQSQASTRGVGAPGLRTPPVAWGIALIGAYVVVMLIALSVGAYRPLFFGLGERGGQGIDFFCVPKAYLNLLHGQSAFDTWRGVAYGPYATWFVLHPAVALWIGGYLAWLSPWIAYGAWVAITLALLLACAQLLAHHAPTPWRKTLAFGAILASPVTYLLLHCGNIHGVVVFAVTLILVGLYELGTASSAAGRIDPRMKVASGLLLSLLTKPVLILVVPALLVARTTRRVVLGSLAAYALISLAFLLVPLLNPQSVGVERETWLAFHSAWVRQELNVYVNHFMLSRDMLDNAMHWLHMVAQSDYALDHVQVFSMPVLVQSAFGVPVSAFRFVALVPVVSSLLLLKLPEPRRPLAAAWLVVLVLASHFLGYAVAWEYQYTQLLVVVGALIALPSLTEKHPCWVKVALASLVLYYLPTPYAWLSTGGLSPVEIAIMRLCRVGPAVLTAVASLAAVIQLVRTREQPSRAATEQQLDAAAA